VYFQVRGAQGVLGVTMEKKTFAATIGIATACAIVASAAWATAADHPLAGTRLVAKSRAGKQSFVWVSKDANVAWPINPAYVFGATLSVRAGDGDSITIPLSASYWRHNGPAQRERYANPKAPGGDSLCRLVLVAGGKLIKASCRNDLIDTLDVNPEASVDVELVVGADRYCASFGGVVRDESGSFLARNAPAPTECPQLTTTTLEPCPVTTTTTLPGCGFFDNPNQCVDSVCPAPQVCADDGMGQCGCTGPPVPCGEVSPVSICALGDCPPGLLCGMLRHGPPACFNECSCQ
jgi:hypothetical protein